MKSIFAYGTLMNREVWEKIVTGKYKSAKGILTGFEKRKIINKSYPGLIESRDKETSGIIYSDINEEDLKKLDLFEGDEYEKINVDAMALNNKRINCITYLFKKKYKYLLSEEKWSYESFLKNDINNFISNYKGWQKI